MIGRVVSVKSLNTATVLVERTVKHPLYKKTYMQSKKYLVDTSNIEIELGAIVNFVGCKPISKNKHWKITKVLGRSFAEIAEAHLKEGAEGAISEVMPEEKEVNRVEGIGSSEEVKQPEEKKETKKRVRKEKLTTKP